MSPSDIILPDDRESMVKLYLHVNQRINEIWREYVSYTNLAYVPSTTKIFAIIFCEMDFYEALLGRIRVHLSHEDIMELKKHDAIWDW